MVNESYNIAFSVALTKPFMAIMPPVVVLLYLCFVPLQGQAATQTPKPMPS